MVVTTVDDHGLATGDEAIVSEVLRQTGANRRWTVTVTGPKTFSLDGSVGIAELGDSTGSGRVVATKVIPDCTGTQTAKGPPPVITNKACEPWRLYEPGESRVFY